MRMYPVLTATLVAAAVGSTASAQLVFGTTTTSTSNPAAVYLDVSTGTTQTLWNSASNKKVNGIAYDHAAGRIYANDAARLNYWPMGSIGVAPTLIAGMYRTNDNITFVATGVDGLCSVNGNLYGSTSFGSTIYDKGIYKINTTPDGMPTNHCVMTPLWLDPTGVGTYSGDITFGDIEFNYADGLFWCANTSNVGVMTPGIYTVDAFGSGAITKVASFPAGRTNVDGLTIGGGRVWLTEQVKEINAVSIYPFNPATGLYDATINFALTDGTNRASDATWVPTPGAGALLALAGLAGLRRRRN